ncbi:hypothetical protein B0J17DRAFT_707743 [Rhizoctonia solani]|nr:hypothetical protein B0J17DRAFT_707743 [Rhizoctonia solani]
MGFSVSAVKKEMRDGLDGVAASACCILLENTSFPLPKEPVPRNDLGETRRQVPWNRKNSNERAEGTSSVTHRGWGNGQTSAQTTLSAVRKNYERISSTPNTRIPQDIEQNRSSLRPQDYRSDGIRPLRPHPRLRGHTKPARPYAHAERGAPMRAMSRPGACRRSSLRHAQPIPPLGAIAPDTQAR